MLIAGGYISIRSESTCKSVAVFPQEPRKWMCSGFADLCPDITAGVKWGYGRPGLTLTSF